MSNRKDTIVGKSPQVDEKAFDRHGTSTSTELSSGVDVVEWVSSEEERALTTKIDLKLLPICGFIFLICFLDRTNIANARLAGLEEGLNMPSTGYNTALWIFYIPFVLAEVPSNMIMSLPNTKPNLFLGIQMLILGVLAMCQGLTRSYSGLLAVRFLMGIVETGLPSGATLLIASYYRKRESPLRFAIFLAFGEAGSCFSGLLAYAITGMNGTSGYEGWRWIFILEGLITIVFSVFIFIFMPNFPTKERGLTEKERTRLLARLENDKGKENTQLSHVAWKNVFFNYKIWLLTLLFFCADMSAGSLAAFNPTILSQLGWRARRAQVMTIPVWIVGIVGALLSSLASGRFNMRWPFILVAICSSVVGWSIHYCQVEPPQVRYFAQFLISFGTFVQMPLYIGLLTANLRGRAFQSFGTALQFGLGNCANFVSSNVFISKQAPRYPVGFGTGLGITVASFPLMLVTMTIFYLHNKKVRGKSAALAPGEELDDQTDYIYVI
ncbi:transporter-like protein [Phlyctema vagabunda]|uniref:Transporter-like protein n=1 Tax=Phlyctema vagabunda TaxID=108571 RepID=A0ABR4PHM7_9HELO